MGTIQAPPIGTGHGESDHGRGWGAITPPGGSLPNVKDRHSDPNRSGIFVALAAIMMMFAAFTSAMFVRESSSSDWLHIDLPRIIYFNTFVLVLSSVALEVAKKKIANYVRGISTRKSVATQWLYLSLALGLAFVAGQFVVWQDLKAQGLYLATNPTSSFFYVLTVFHVVHVVGGLGGLVRVLAIFQRPAIALRRSTLDSTSYYWHFMGILWIYLLFIIVVKM